MRAVAVLTVACGSFALTVVYMAWVLHRATRRSASSAARRRTFFSVSPRWPPLASNYRGVALPLVLGYGFLIDLFWVAAFRGHWFGGSFVRNTPVQRLAMEGSILLVLLAGMYDDLNPGRSRGLREHVRQLAHGRLTSGIVKVLVIAGAATAAAFGLSHAPARIALGIPLMAGAANVWNMLDVRPGRAIKSFLLASAALIGWYATYDDLLLAAGMGSAAALVCWDLRERAMLGDAGSNVLGFIVGLALFRILPTWGLAVALGAILALHALGETVTLSRLIEGTQPLRWFDRLGRLRLEASGGAAREDSSIE